MIVTSFGAQKVSSRSYCQLHQMSVTMPIRMFIGKVGSPFELHNSQQSWLFAVCSFFVHTYMTWQLIRALAVSSRRVRWIVRNNTELWDRLSLDISEQSDERCFLMALCQWISIFSVQWRNRRREVGSHLRKEQRVSVTSCCTRSSRRVTRKRATKSKLA